MEMTFSQRVKQEIAARPAAAPCCVAAACYGVACFSKYFDARGVVLHTDSDYIARWALGVYAESGIAGRVRARNAASWEFAVKDAYEADKLLAMFGHSGEEPTRRLRRENLNCSNCVSAFVAAAFLCCGTTVNPEKGYMLEFVFSRHGLMRDLADLLAEHGFALKSTVRGGAVVLYCKASEQVEDMLTYMGAPQCALEIMNLKVYRDLRNRANRITNCETANIDKIVLANRATLDAIGRLQAHGRLDTLPGPLREAARLRQAYPDLSLQELVALSPNPVSKSGLSHRYKKIREKAQKINRAE
jgi:DNA-binding protein WhiA